MGIAAKLDDLGKPAWIALVVLSFMAWWPLGVAVAAYVIGSGRMGTKTRGCFGRWFKNADDMASRAFDGLSKGAGGSSGNRAFDEYRSETLRRLEDEQREFKDFLTRLRMAKDKAEFDQFMAERRGQAGNHSSAA
jgi:hypothetical protein